jgi:aminopeptidase
MRSDGVRCAVVNDALLARYAKLIVETGTNVQPGQDVLVIAAPESARLVRAIAGEAYARGARFVDPWYFDPQVKRIRALTAAEETLEFTPPWIGSRLTRLGEGHGVRISISPNAPPGLMNGVDPAKAGRDQLPSVPQHLEVINAKTTNWCVVPWATPAWASFVHPDLDEETALARLFEELIYVLRLDEDDVEAAWNERFAELHVAGTKLDALGLDTLHFEGPGTDLQVGLLPTSCFAGDEPGAKTVDGVVFHANIPTEEVFTTPDPERVEGHVTATKPLDLAGTVVDGLRIRFEGGRAVSVDADEGADALRARVTRDDGASRLGEVALVDREGRIGKTGTVFFNTLLDENAASHIALGNAYATAVHDEDRDRINKSGIHIDFMIGSDEVTVSGLTRDGREVPILRGGRWQV